MTSTSPELAPVGAPAEPNAREVSDYVKRSLVNTALGMLLMLVVLGIVGVLYEREIVASATFVGERLGLAGLAALLIVADTLISPVPPDVVLLVVANTGLSQSWLPIVTGFGLLSALAGCLGYRLGRWWGAHGRALPRFIKNDRMTEALVTRYGRWAVVLGALTPIPFSVTCWLAGMCRMRFGSFFPLTLLRIPRFVAYYLVISGADDLLRALL